jgi:hypothetical protein
MEMADALSAAVAWAENHGFARVDARTVRVAKALLDRDDDLRTLAAFVVRTDRVQGFEEGVPGDVVAILAKVTP